jgi:hypothetical protein
MSCRGMNKETEVKKIRFITSFCSNIPDLYGVVRGDDALISRLVIIEMNENTNKPAFYKFTHELYDPSTPEFKYSFDQWLLNDFEIPTDFCPCRYYGKEKYEFIRNAKTVRRNSAEQWFSYMIEQKDESFSELKFKKIPRMSACCSTINRNYKEYVNGKEKTYSDDNVLKFLETLGFKQYKRMGLRYIGIETEKFNAICETYGDNIPEMNPDEDYEAV